MRLRFDTLTLENFRSFSEKTVVDLDDLPIGLIFVRGFNEIEPELGSNGAGKSSLICGALMWCITGKTVDGLRNTDIAPWTEEGKTTVTLKYRIDNQEHSICRTANPNSLTYDNREVGQDTIDRAFSIPTNIIPHTILLGQGQPLFFDLPPRTMMDMFVEVLGLVRWDERAEQASTMAKQAEQKRDGYQTEIDVHKDNLRETREQLEGIRQQATEWEDQRQTRLNQADTKIDELTTKIVAKQVERDGADLAYDGAKTELYHLDIQLDKLQEESNTLTDELNDLNVEIAQQKAKRERLQSDLKALDNNICPTCRRPFSNHNKLRKQLEDQLQKLKSPYREEFDELENLRTQVATKIRNLMKARPDLETKEDKARLTLDRLTPQLSEWKTELRLLKEAKQEYDKDRNPYTDQANILKRRINGMLDQIDELKLKVTSSGRRFHRAKFWATGFKEIRLYIIEELLQELELTTNAMMGEFGLIDWKVKYHIERETKTGTTSRGLFITVLSPHNKKAVRWASWSGGEAQRLRLIGSIALAEVLLNWIGVDPNLEVLDEPTKGLSQEGVENLVDLMADWARRLSRKVVLIDHHAVESARFAAVLSVVKDRAGSRLSAIE